jgi:hypothetical protein
VGNGGGSEVLHPEKKTRGEAGPKMWAKRAPAQSSLRGGEEVVAPVISGDSGDTSATGVDGRLRESEGGGGWRPCAMAEAMAWKEEKGKGRGTRRHDLFIPVCRGGGRVGGVAPHGRQGPRVGLGYNGGRRRWNQIKISNSIEFKRFQFVSNFDRPKNVLPGL